MANRDPSTGQFRSKWGSTPTSKVVTLDEAIAEIDREIATVIKLTMAALWEAALKILAAAQKRLRASVITGNLRASGYARKDSRTTFTQPEALIAERNDPVPGDTLGKIGVEVGFTANYAIFVHENMEGRTPKFLENVIIENRDRIVAIIKHRTGAE